MIGVTILFGFLLLPPSHKQPAETYHLEGSMFVSDAGRSHGGFEYNALYKAELDIDHGNGVLRLVLESGLGDTLDKREYLVSNFKMTTERISMKIEGAEVVLEWVKSDLVWDHQYDNHYIAAWGGDAPAEEIRGVISPEIFPGLASHYYVELRLHPT